MGLRRGEKWYRLAPNKATLIAVVLGMINREGWQGETTGMARVIMARGEVVSAAAGPRRSGGAIRTREMYRDGQGVLKIRESVYVAHPCCSQKPAVSAATRALGLNAGGLDQNFAERSVESAML